MKELDAERWERFVAYAARARSKPAYELEERDSKQTILLRTREAMGFAHPSQLPSRMERLEPTIRNRFALLRPEDLEWLRQWAATDPGSLAEAVSSFRWSRGDEYARFAAWADVCERAVRTLDADATLAVGSLFNFALEPHLLPIMSQPAFEWLESELGYEGEPGGPLAERYRAHLDFAQQIRRGLSDAGLPVRDMMDVQSLIFLAAEGRDFWAVDPPPGGSLFEATTGERPYLAVCAIYRNEAPYLAEWIELHRVAGAERFFLYDNRSSDEHLEVLAPYIRDGTVVVHEWPLSPGQIEAYDHCLEAHRADSRWIAFIDVDEFLFSPELRPLPEVLRGYEEFPAVGVNRATFGTSGHRTPPAGLVTESYVHRGGKDRFVKSIVQPAATVRCLSAHRFEYRYRLAVDENRYPIPRDATKSVSFARLRINHYYTKSEAELREKLAATRADYGQARPGSWELDRERFNEEHDDLIASYGPQVRAALERSR